ncbi:MAG: thiamine phosphate synthase [Brevundimonas sp.]
MNRTDADILWDVARVLARDVAKVSLAAGRPAPDLPPMLFFTDPDRTPRPWQTAARLPPGAGVVFRHFGRPDAAGTARRLREVTAERGVLLLIGLDAALAEAVGADGVHLPERSLDEAARLKAARPDWRVTGALHSHHRPTPPGLDALVVSPVFPAGGASAARSALGVDALSRWIRAAPLPVYALGGVDRDTAPGLIGSGACGLAAVSAIQAAFGPI